MFCSASLKCCPLLHSLKGEGDDGIFRAEADEKAILRDQLVQERDLPNLEG